MSSNKQLIAQRFNRYFESYQYNAQQQYHIANELIKHLIEYKLQANQILEIGCGTGFLTEHLLKHLKINQLYLNDIAYRAFDNTKKALSQFDFNEYQFIEGDAEQIKLPYHLDLVCSASTFQWFNNLPIFLKHIKKHLTKDGILAFSTFGTQNYYEIKQLTHIGLDYLTFDRLITETQKHFKILCAKQWQDKIWFNSPKEVLKHIKQTGVNGIQQSLQGKSWYYQFNKDYEKLFSQQGKVHLTYHPIIIIAKHD